ncbi:MAG TPA: sensor histidine kinase [Pseudonocardiaceae bacterium]|jgi:signal transduction histidine kinase|nr:sensor histidine kinase [Pseudonocardiaceae bacterium]
MDDPDLRPLLTGRLRPGHLIAFDAVIAIALVIAICGNLAAGNVRPPDGVPVWAAWVVGIAVGLPVLLRRRRPIPALAAATVIAALSTVVGYPVVGYLGVAVVAHMVASVESLHRSVTALVACLVVSVVVLAVASRADPIGAIGFVSAAVVVAWLIGRIARERRIAAGLAAERRAEHALAEERLRIARELHDIVAHGMSLVAVKAAVANHVAVDRPDEARDALSVIETVSRDSLAELRRMLGVLRSGDTPAEPAGTGPAPGIAGLPDLVDRAVSAGVRAELDVRATGPLPEGISVAVYRIVQEAVTNVIKHAAPATCRITVATRGGRVRVDVTDDGERALPVSVAATGHGLLGMRERVLLYGGELRAGPRPNGGFAVSAELPFEPTGARV